MADEALMNRFGAIVTAARMSRAEELLLIGDVNLPYIDRENLCNMLYRSPSQMLSNSKNLLCTHRSPIDVAYVLREIYCGIYSAKRAMHFIHIVNIKATPVSKDLKNTFYLTFTQEGKD